MVSKGGTHNARSRIYPNLSTYQIHVLKQFPERLYHQLQKKQKM